MSVTPALNKAEDMSQLKTACADLPRSYVHDASDATFRRTASLCLRYALCVITQQNATFWGVAHPAGGYDPKFELGRDLCTMHLRPKFRLPMFTHSEVIVLTHKQTDAAESIQSSSLCYDVG